VAKSAENRKYSYDLLWWDVLTLFPEFLTETFSRNLSSVSPVRSQLLRGSNPHGTTQYIFTEQDHTCTHSGAVDTIPSIMFNPISSHLAGKTLRLFDPDCDSSNQDFYDF
jgi:hypothetical protein